MCYYGSTGAREFLFDDDPEATGTLKSATSEVGLNERDHMYYAKFMCKITLLETEKMLKGLVLDCSNEVHGREVVNVVEKGNKFILFVII